MHSNKKIVIVHPGTQHSTHIAKQLYRKNMLYKLVTGFAISKRSWISKLIQVLPSSLAKPISNRMIAVVPASKLKTYPLTELKFVKKANKASNKEAVWFERNEHFQQKVPSRILQNSDVIIGFDTSSWILEQRAKALNKKFILDVSIAHSVSKNKAYEAIALQFPEWSFALEHKSKHLLDTEQKEYEHADGIIAASLFTKQTLIDNGVDQNKIFINPYGIDSSLFKLKEKFYDKGPVKFIFVGIVDARKGIPLLMDVIKKIPPTAAEFSFVGPVSSKIEAMIQDYQLPNVYVVGKVPHAELATVFGKHDVFVFPSYFEGFGLVILEAMAIGLPVITTTATGGPDCIENGKEGFIINCGDEQALHTSIDFFIKHPNEIERMGIAARKKAEQFSWDAYGDRYSAIINTVCANSN
jgi:starch synthase